MLMFFLIFVIPLGLFVFGAAWYMANHTELGKDLISLYSEEEPKIPEIKRCVMCHEKLDDVDESKKWKGAHEWCEGYY